MAVTYGFYNSLNGDRKYYAEQMSSIFNGIITDGVFSAIGDALMTVAGSATSMQVIVKTGRAWFNGTWTQNDAQLPLDIPTADVSLTRIDAVVLEVNTSNSVRANSIKVVKGTASANPQKPTLTNENLIHQYALAYVTVPAGATSITASNIEVNVGKTGCPFITSVLQQADITDVFNQWEAEFDEWFANVKSTLSGDVATNLQRQIDAVNDKVTETNSAISKLNEDLQLKIGDVLVTTRTNPGEKFVLCNGQSIPYQSNLSLPIGFVKRNPVQNIYTSQQIAMSGDNQCGIFYTGTNASTTSWDDLRFIFVRDIKNGICDAPVVINDKMDFDYCYGVYFKGTWIAVGFNNTGTIYIYTASDPTGVWAEKTISLNSNDLSGYLSNVRVVNGYAVIVWRCSSRSDRTLLVFTDDLTNGWTRNQIANNYAYDALDIGYYNGYYYLINSFSSYNHTYRISYANSLSSAIWNPIGDDVLGIDTTISMTPVANSCQSDGLYILLAYNNRQLKVLKITSFDPINVETCFKINYSNNYDICRLTRNSTTFGRYNGIWYIFGVTSGDSLGTTSNAVICISDDISKDFTSILPYYSIYAFGNSGYAEYNRIVIPCGGNIITNDLQLLPNITTNLYAKHFLKISDTE